MRNDFLNRGFIKSLVVLVVGGCSVLFVLALLASYVKPSGGALNFNTSLSAFPANNMLPTSGTGSLIGRRPVSNTNTNTLASSYTNKVTLSRGNVTTAQPYQEYIVIRNSGPAVNITGWSLTNGKGTKPIQNSQNTYFFPTPDVAVIGQGTEYLDPSGKQYASNIILKSGDTAYVMTGGPFSQYSFPIPTSFRENVCTGYLKVYPFNPPLSRSCPDVRNDPAIGTITDQCYDYATRISRCLDPEKDDEERYDEQTSQCQVFLSSRLNYPSCFNRNRYDDDFLLKRWRIFLGKGREMWASRREIITLYDSSGKIVDQLSY